MRSQPPGSKTVTRFVVSPRQHNDPRSAGYLAGAHSLGITAVTSILCQDLYFIEGDLAEEDLKLLAASILSDPVTQDVCWEVVGDAPGNAPVQHVIEVTLRPGVTDPVAREIVRAASVLGVRGVEQASCGLRFLIDGANLTGSDLHLLADRLLANPTIQRYSTGAIAPVFPHPAEASGHVEVLPIRSLDDAGLLALSAERRSALDLAEMSAIQAYYRSKGREPTDVEIETIAQTWSEHCVHKTFKAKIHLEDTGEIIDGLLNTYLRAATERIAAPWVRSAFVDNAGIIDFDDELEVSFKVETHNHPSAIEPFGGANTGVGGVIRDILGVSADPIAATDVLCFGPQETDIDSLPPGVLHPKRIRSGVIAGVQDYGNKIGIPTVNGAILYDPGYTANPLVFCGCVGIAPKDSHPRNPQPGDRVIVLGGRTGRDGLRGATFSSMAMNAQTGVVSGASVQIGDPITEKGLLDVIRAARERKLYHAITDCGAGGLSSAVGEMGRDTGVSVDLQRVRLKYPGLKPWEIWLSEAQERMVLAVPAERTAELKELCRDYEVEYTDIGEFTSGRQLIVRYGEKVVLELDNDFLHDGIPTRTLRARIPEVKADQPPAKDDLRDASALDYSRLLLSLLAHPNIASKENVIRVYDHEVQGGTVIKPLTGILSDGPSDACVLKPACARPANERQPGIALSNGINPEYSKLDPYRMAVSAIDEAVRNAVAVGADPARLALLDNFCWGDPLKPETLGGLVQAARGCFDTALAYGAPFISGKDSLNNEYLGSDGQRHAIPPTLLISAIGIVPDINRTVTMDLKREGNILYLVGDFDPVFGGSHISLLTGDPRFFSEVVPGLPRRAAGVYRALHEAVKSGLIQACHDLSEGGLGVCAAEMCIGGRLGMRLALAIGEPALELFGETNGCLLMEVEPADVPAFESCFASLPYRWAGRVSAADFTVVTRDEQVLFSLPLEELVQAWKGVEA